MKYILTLEAFNNKLVRYRYEDFLKHINVSPNIINDAVRIMNRTGIDLKVIYTPINGFIGGVISDDTIIINSNSNRDINFLLFISFHEVRHIMQNQDGGKMDKYYLNPVVINNREMFNEYYRKLEMDANDFAFASMKEIGFDMPPMLRGNESMASPVFDMMSRDIKIYNPRTMYDLIKLQTIGNVDVDEIEVYRDIQVDSKPQILPDYAFDFDEEENDNADLVFDFGDDESEDDFSFNFDDDDD